jgi:hypothetical protein
MPSPLVIAGPPSFTPFIGTGKFGCRYHAAGHRSLGANSSPCAARVTSTKSGGDRSSPNWTAKVLIVPITSGARTERRRLASPVSRAPRGSTGSKLELTTNLHHCSRSFETLRPQRCGEEGFKAALHKRRSVLPSARRGRYRAVLPLAARRHQPRSCARAMIVIIVANAGVPSWSMPTRNALARRRRIELAPTACGLTARLGGRPIGQQSLRQSRRRRRRRTGRRPRRAPSDATLRRRSPGSRGETNA